jgi:hypothetical protein
MQAVVMDLERLNVLSIARLQKDNRRTLATTQGEDIANRVNGGTKVMNDEFGEIGYTSKDREAVLRSAILLTEIEKKLDRYDLRFERIEREKIAKDETDRITKGISKDIAELQTLAAKLEARLAIVEKELWKWIAWGGGVATATGIIVGLVVHFISK